MRTLRRYIIILTLVLTSIGANAQCLSLDSCKTLAVANNIKLKQAYLQVEASEQVKLQALSKYFPNISASLIGYHALEPLFEYGINNISNTNLRNTLRTLYNEYGSTLGIPDRISLFQRGYVAGLSVMQPVFMGGRIVNGNKLANLGIEASKLKVNLSEREVITQVEENYLLILSLLEKQKMVNQALVFLDTLYHDVSVAFEAGLVLSTDKLMVELKKDEMESNKLQVENGLSLAKMNLCQIIGITYTDSLSFKDSLNIISIEDLEFMDIPKAVNERTESKLLDMQVRAKELERKMTWGETLPQVGIGGTYSYGNMLNDGKWNGMLFASVSVPITAWWETGHKLKEQSIKIQMAENERKDLTEKMELQTMQAWYQLKEADMQVKLAEKSVHKSQENLRLSHSNFNAGLIPLSDLMQAQTLHLQTQETLTTHRINLQIKLLIYKQLIGG